MPFVQRNWKGEVTGLFARSQANEELPEDDPEVIAFRQAHPIDPRMLSPRTPAEIDKSNRDHMRVEADHKLIAAGVVKFNRLFTELETAMSALMYALINKPDSQIAYAIYYSPTSFEARATLVENSLVQLSSENVKLVSLIKTWESARDYLQKVRRLRNGIAHGAPLTVVINAKQYARLAAPAFDIIRIGRPIAKRQVPGITHQDIEQGVQHVLRLREVVESVNRLVSSFHDGDPALQDKFAALDLSLTKLRNR
jgi:hypothetical protein